MQIPIDEIRQRRRVRQNLTDIESLMDSLRRFGQLSPVLLNGKRCLIAGARRLEAARRLGWHSVAATVLEGDDPVRDAEMEIEDNIRRVPLTEAELREGYRRLEKLRNPGFLTRAWRGIVGFFRSVFACRP